MLLVAQVAQSKRDNSSAAQMNGRFGIEALNVLR